MPARGMYIRMLNVIKYWSPDVFFPLHFMHEREGWRRREWGRRREWREEGRRESREERRRLLSNSTLSVTRSVKAE